MVTEQQVASTSASAVETPWQARNRKAKKEGARGTVFLGSGEQYKGEWHGDKRHGTGVMTYANADRYQGEWRGGRRHGAGTLWVLNAAGKYVVRYSGDWARGVPEGSGTLYAEDGCFYEGGFVAGLRHGRGRAVTGGDVYEGCWQHDMRHGPGTLMLASGDMFEGHWEADLKHGPGTFFFFARGCRYDGVWAAGVPTCGSYSEVQPRPPGAPGALPNIELAAPEAVLQQAEADLAAAVVHGAAPGRGSEGPHGG